MNEAMHSVAWVSSSQLGVGTATSHTHMELMRKISYEFVKELALHVNLNLE